MTTQHNENKLQLNDLPDVLIGEITKHLDPPTIIKLLPESYYPPGLARKAHTHALKRERDHQSELLAAQLHYDQLKEEKEQNDNFMRMYREWWAEERREKRELQQTLQQLQEPAETFQNLRNQLEESQQATARTEQLLNEAREAAARNEELLRERIEDLEEAAGRARERTRAEKIQAEQARANLQARRERRKETRDKNREEYFAWAQEQRRKAATRKREDQEKPLERMTVKEMKEECKQKGLRRYSALRRAELVELCREARSRAR